MNERKKERGEREKKAEYSSTIQHKKQWNGMESDTNDLNREMQSLL